MPAVISHCLGIEKISTPKIPASPNEAAGHLFRDVAPARVREGLPHPLWMRFFTVEGGGLKSFSGQALGSEGIWEDFVEEGLNAKTPQDSSPF